MKKSFLIAVFTFLALSSCQKEEKAKPISEKNEVIATTHITENEEVVKVERITKKNPKDFIPKGFVFFEEVYGDLNKDGLKDCILIIKGTDKDKFVVDESSGKLDRNRRGIIVLFKTKNNEYELITENDTCFSSENEEGGAYYAPELMVYEEKGNLFVHYAHGRYGYWKYTFRLKDSDFQLIGYDSSDNTGPRVNNETSINYLTRKRQDKTNTNNDAESGDEIFEEKWSTIKVQKPIMLSEIKDFDELDSSV